MIKFVNFFKEHKKKIIIGSVVVGLVSIVVIIVKKFKK